MGRSTILRMGVTTAVVTLGLFAVTAEAQQPPATPKASSATTAPSTTATKATTPAATKPAAKKPASPCAKLLEPACKAKAECLWVVPTKASTKTGKVPAPYCRLKPKPKTAGQAAPGTATTKPAAAPPKATTAPAAK